MRIGSICQTKIQANLVRGDGLSYLVIFKARPVHQFLPWLTILLYLSRQPTHFKMTILLTGGLGKTASRLARILTSENKKILVASRSGSAADYPAVKFDWNDRSSWNAAFDSPEAKASPITAIYLVILLDEDDASYNTAMDFINLARQRGTKRFVFLSTSAIDEHGPTWRSRLHSTFKNSDYEWAILRPSWFMRTLYASA